MASDFSEVSEQPTNLLVARNVAVRQGFIERAPGAIRLEPFPTNPGSLPGSILEFEEYFPTDFSQRVVAICSDGNTYKITPWYDSSLVSSSDGFEPVMKPLPTATMVVGGAEQPGNPRKLFVFSGGNQVQVITGDGTTRRNIALPALDWGNSPGTPGYSASTPQNYPTAAVLFNGSLWAWGCPNSPHTVFVSNPNDHEDFQTLSAAQVISLFAGDSDRIADGFVFKTRIYFTKFPRGLYYVDTTTSTFIPNKLGDSFGACFPRTSVQALDNAYIANSVGSITSLQAVFSLGQTEQGDLLKQLKNANFATQYLTGTTLNKKRAIYYENKKQVIIGSAIDGTPVMKRTYVVDFSANNPIFSFYDKDIMPSLNLVRDCYGIPKPVYGGTDGNFYDMDSVMRNVNGAGYVSEFQTHNMDFKWAFVGLNVNMEEKDKHFDYVGLTFEPTGVWNVSVDAYVDGNKRASISFPQNRGTYMDGQFPLDESSLVGKNTVTRTLPLRATGKKLRLRVYTNGVDQNFRITALTVFLRPAGENNRSG